MPRLYKDEGVVLKTIKLGEADRIVTVYTRSTGKIRAVAKGVRRTRSRFGARLEPYTRVDLLVYKGRNLDTITGAHIITAFDDVRTRYDRLTAASALAELVDKVTPDRERSVPTYGLLLAGLQAIADGHGATVVPAFTVKLLSLSGYHPQLQACAGCGTTEGLRGFSPAMGGAVCAVCWREDRSAIDLGPDRIALLASMLSSEFGTNGAGDAVLDVTRALKTYVEYHLESSFRSIHFLAAN